MSDSLRSHQAPLCLESRQESGVGCHSQALQGRPPEGPSAPVAARGAPRPPAPRRALPSEPACALLLPPRSAPAFRASPGPSVQTPRQGAARACLSVLLEVYLRGRFLDGRRVRAYPAVPTPQGLCAQQGGDLSPRPFRPRGCCSHWKWGFSKHLWIVQKGGSTT